MFVRPRDWGPYEIIRSPDGLGQHFCLSIPHFITLRCPGTHRCTPSFSGVALRPEQMVIDKVGFCCISLKIVCGMIKWPGLKKRRMYPSWGHVYTWPEWPQGQLSEKHQSEGPRDWTDRPIPWPWKAALGYRWGQGSWPFGFFPI